jgi:DNA modification methylase
LSEGERRALALADNRLAEDAVWNEELLRAELAALRDDSFDLELTGFEEKELERLLKELSDSDPLKPIDSTLDVPSVPTSVRADLWCTGEHRVMCGDATLEKDVDRLMLSGHGDLGMADPFPQLGKELAKEDYGFPDDATKIRFRDVLTSAFVRLRQVLKPQAPLYVCYPWQRQHVFQEALEQAQFTIECQIIWAMNTPAQDLPRYKAQHETVFYAHIRGQQEFWFGKRAQSSIWQADGIESENRQPGVKPIEHVERAVKNSSRAGDVVVDLFGGAGTTLIACERVGRKARVMEIEPAYVDLIVGRWQQLTGKSAILDGDGRTFDEITEHRRQAGQPRNQMVPRLKNVAGAKDWTNWYE